MAYAISQSGCTHLAVNWFYEFLKTIIEHLKLSKNKYSYLNSASEYTILLLRLLEECACKLFVYKLTPFSYERIVEDEAELPVMFLLLGFQLK